ncbi:nuclear transport factor 2 family protein [Actinoplanes sp. NPDC051513]|uniref:nuclear transport factor 2 family protein n=1 Tax=Actinoplanes sp. NPDC051513 TaxID=3363908 RepID=UPI00378BD4DA
MNDDKEAIVTTLQDRVNRALLTGDWHTLTDLVAPDALITGPRGYMITRDNWINVHREEAYEQVRLDVVESTVHAYDAAGVRFDLVESECIYHGETIKGRFRVSQAWASHGGRWQLTSVQYTTAA